MSENNATQVIKLVRIGEHTHIGFLEGSCLKDSMQLFSQTPNPGDPLGRHQDPFCIGDELHSQAVAGYLVFKELGKLTSMNIGSVDTISYRELTEDELHLMEEVNFTMDRARKTAMADVVVTKFRGLLGK